MEWYGLWQIYAMIWGSMNAPIFGMVWWMLRRISSGCGAFGLGYGLRLTWLPDTWLLDITRGRIWHGSSDAPGWVWRAFKGREGTFLSLDLLALVYWVSARIAPVFWVSARIAPVCWVSARIALVCWVSAWIAPVFWVSAWISPVTSYEKLCHRLSKSGMP